MGRIQKLREQKKLEEQQKQEQTAQRNKKILTGVVIAAAALILIIYVGKVLLTSKPEAISSPPATPAATATAKLDSLFPSLNPVANPPTNQKIAVIETERGIIRLELYPLAAPKTVENFIKLAVQGFYNGLKFHRVVPGFVIQGGDPKGDGTGGPGYTFEDEINPWGLELSEETIQALQAQGYQYSPALTSHKMTAGALAMANSGPNTNGSQFFIVTEQEQPHLNGKHTVFGQVIEGLKVVRQIQQDDIMEKVYIVSQ